MTPYTGKTFIRKFYCINLKNRRFKIVYSVENEHIINVLCVMICNERLKRIHHMERIYY